MDVKNASLMYAKKRPNRIIALLQNSNGIRSDLKRASTAKSSTMSYSSETNPHFTILTVPLSIKITQKESPVRKVVPIEFASNSNSIPRIDLNLFNKSPTEKSYTTNLAEIKRSRPYSAGCNAFMHQTTIFTANSFKRRRNSEDTGNLLVSGSSLVQTSPGKNRNNSIGKARAIYRRRSLLN